MKHLYTSNYSRAGKLPEAVVISCTFPKWFPESEFQGVKRTDLAPEWWMVEKVNNGEIDTDVYSQMYLHLLTAERGLTADAIIDSLDDGSILICYEKPGAPCHRRTLAIWLEEESDLTIPEWLNENELAEQQKQQQRDQLVDSLLNFEEND